MANQNVFIPRSFQSEAPKEPEKPVQSEPKKDDKLGKTLHRITQYLVVALAFLLPLFFVPGLYASLGFDKVILATGLSLTIVVIASLSALRYSQVRPVLPLPYFIFWGIAGIALVSALLSGDIQDSLVGSYFEIHTTGFLLLLALVITTTLVLQRSKIMSLQALLALLIGAGVLIIYNLVRFFAGPVLPLNSFGDVTVSPLGGLNDLAVFAGVTIILSLVALLQLPLKMWTKSLLACLCVASLLVLAVVNFFYIWLGVGFFSLLLLIYLLSRDTLFGHEDETPSTTTRSLLLIILSLVIGVVSAVFVIAGNYAGSVVSQATNIDYIEVRPSLSATADIARATYQDNLLLGSGPNRFADMWRLHKDRSINDTNFWNVDFTAGFGFVPTYFITLGALGGVAFITFHLAYLLMGYQMLIKTQIRDQFWYFFGTVTFVASLLLWGVTYVYVPGAAILLLTALFTGLSFVAYGALMPATAITIPLIGSRRQGFLLMAITVILVVGSVVLLFFVGQQYAAQYEFTRGQVVSESVEEFEGSVERAYMLFNDNQFLAGLAQLKLSVMQSLTAIEEPTEADQNNFAETAQEAIVLAEQIITNDPTDPTGYALLADVYYLLDQAGLEGAKERADAALASAQERDPKDPGYDLASAVVASRAGNTELAREEIANALTLKRNYVDALFLLAQLDIEEGNIESAIAATTQVVTLEPNNPTRYYQLGILLAANEQYDQAIAAYQEALLRDNSFANARYMLAMAYVAAEQVEAALEELRIVQSTNEENEELAALIVQLETTGTLPAATQGLESPINENDSAATADGVVTDEVPESNVISPINTNASSGEAGAQ